jgi:hypothetical protein
MPLSSIVEVEARPKKSGVSSSSISMLIGSLTAFFAVMAKKWIEWFYEYHSLILLVFIPLYDWWINFFNLTVPYFFLFFLHTLFLKY